jgi:hypothetical protein
MREEATQGSIRQVCGYLGGSQTAVNGLKPLIAVADASPCESGFDRCPAIIRALEVDEIAVPGRIRHRMSACVPPQLSAGD